MRTAEVSKNSNYYLFGGDNMIAYLINATSGNHTLLAKFTFSNNVLDSDFSDDE